MFVAGRFDDFFATDGIFRRIIYRRLTRPTAKQARKEESGFVNLPVRALHKQIDPGNPGAIIVDHQLDVGKYSRSNSQSASRMRIDPDNSYRSGSDYSSTDSHFPQRAVSRCLSNEIHRRHRRRRSYSDNVFHFVIDIVNRSASERRS